MGQQVQAEGACEDDGRAIVDGAPRPEAIRAEQHLDPTEEEHHCRQHQDRRGDARHGMRWAILTEPSVATVVPHRAPARAGKFEDQQRNEQQAAEVVHPPQHIEVQRRRVRHRKQHKKSQSRHRHQARVGRPRVARTVRRERSHPVESEQVHRRLRQRIRWRAPTSAWSAGAR